MKVAITALDLPPEGGISTYLNNVIQNFSDDDGYYIFILENRTDAIDMEPDNIELILLSSILSNLIIRILYVQFIFPLILYIKDYDVVFSPTGDYTNIISPCPRILVVHDFSPYVDNLHISIDRPKLQLLKFKIQRMLTLLSSKNSECIIFPSEFARDVCIEDLGIPKDKTKIVHHGVDLDKFSPKRDNYNNVANKYLGLDKEQNYILSVSTMNEHKNFEILLKAYADLSNNLQEEYRLVIVGRQPRRSYVNKLEKLAESLGIEKQSKFVGAIEYEKMPNIYQDSSIFILPSKLETFGLTPLEAMACGSPVIAARSTAIPEVVDSHENLFNPDDYRELSDLITEIMTNKRKRYKIVYKGIQRANTMSWKNTSKLTYHIIKSIYLYN